MTGTMVDVTVCAVCQLGRGRIIDMETV